MRTLVILAAGALLSSATGCTTPEDKGSAPAGSDAPAAKDAKSSAPSGAAYDFSKVDRLVTTAKTEDDFDAILKECMTAAFETARAKKVEDVDKDPAYFSRFFVRYAGLTPSAYRQRQADGESRR